MYPNKKISEAVKILNQGGIIIFPTDTAFGIGCRMDDEKAVERLFKIRERPLTQPTPVLISGLDMARKYLKPLPVPVINKLINSYWPGALTIVLPCLTRKVPALVRGNTGTLGVRMPDHQIALELIKQIDVPLLGPSANLHGDKTPYSYDELNKELIKKIDFVLKGICPVKQASTVINCTKKPWQILRQGVVKIDLNLIS